MAGNTDGIGITADADSGDEGDDSDEDEDYGPLGGGSQSDSSSEEEDESDEEGAGTLADITIEELQGLDQDTDAAAAHAQAQVAAGTGFAQQYVEKITQAKEKARLNIQLKLDYEAERIVQFHADIEHAGETVGLIQISCKAQDPHRNKTLGEFNVWINPGEEVAAFWDPQTIAVHHKRPNSPEILAGLTIVDAWQCFTAWMESILDPGGKELERYFQLRNLPLSFLAVAPDAGTNAETACWRLDYPVDAPSAPLKGMLTAWNGKGCDFEWFFKTVEVQYIGRLFMPENTPYFWDPKFTIKVG
jgi:hypothetical protein